MSTARTNAKVGLTRAGVVEAAADLADDSGLAAVTVSSVARVVGVRPPSLYAHVAGTEQLHLAITVLALTELADRIDRAIAGRSGRAALVAFADTHRTYAHERPGRYAAAGALDVEPTPELLAVAARHAEQVLAVLRGYEVPEDELMHATRLIASMVRGFVQLEASGAFARSEPPAAESWLRALEVLHLTFVTDGR